MDEEDYEDEFDEEDEDSGMELIISTGKDGKPILEKAPDFVRVVEKDMNLIRGFIKENQKLFEEYIKKRGGIEE